MISLNAAQRKAVEFTDGPLLIIAGAGTGKTTVITEKIAHILSSGLAKPEDILALTFTEKAAQEMQERVDERIEIGYANLHISTFHSFCQKILEQHGLEVGIPNQFKIVTETEAWLLLRSIFDTLNVSYYRPIANPNRHIHELIKHFQKCKDELISPEAYQQHAESIILNNDAAASEEQSRLLELANIYHAYNQILLDHSALDFADLIFYTHKLLTTRIGTLNRMRQKYTYILVDEFQDVNHAQYTLIKLLAGERAQLTVVGDDDQSIYAFRGASVSNILQFKEDFPQATAIVLNENYRSDQSILDVAYTSIVHNNPDRLEAKLGIDKRLISSQKRNISDQIEKVVHIHTTTTDDEVCAVTDEIISIKSNDPELHWSDFAILVRANSHAEPFLQALENAQIPYDFFASSGLYRQAIVLDSVNFFKGIDNCYESPAIYRLLRLPFLEFSENDMRKFTSMAKRKAVSYYEALTRASEFGLSEIGIQICKKLINLIHSGMKRTQTEKPTNILYHFLEESGYLSYLTHEEQKNNRVVVKEIQHIKQFLDWISQYEKVVPGATVSDLIEHYGFIRQAGDDGAITQLSDTSDSIQIMTIHAAKGLEFNYVFIVNLVEDRFPSRIRSNAIEIPDALVKERLPQGDFHEQEERRLFYVGATRAKRKLYFCSADLYGGVRKKKISRFLAEIGFSFDEKKSGNTSISKENQLLFKPAKTLPHNQEFEYELPKAFSFSQIRSY